MEKKEKKCNFAFGNQRRAPLYERQALFIRKAHQTTQVLHARMPCTLLLKLETKKTDIIMNNITSKHKSCISSKAATAEITSKANLDIHSTTKSDVRSEYMQERDAFLCTAKRNASLMFSKYL